MTVEMFLALCWKRNIKVHRAEKELGYGNGYFRSLKKKEIPANRLQEVANYFGVSLDFMFGATPEAYLLWTEYKLNEAEKAYDKESDPTKRDEIGAEIDALRDSLEDQQIALALTQKKPDTSNGVGTQGNGIIGGLANSFGGPEDADIAQEEWLLRVARTLPAEDRNRLADYAHILATSRGLPVEEPPTGD